MITGGKQAMIQLTQLSRSQPQQGYPERAALGFPQQHRARITSELKQLGAVAYDLWLPETQTLPLIIHPNERILGIVYGRYKQDEDRAAGRGALVATDSRVLLVDKKPLYIKCGEISYRVVSAITYTRVGFSGTITLHTRLGDITMHTLNQTCAHNFVEAIEANIFRPKDGGYYD